MAARGEASDEGCDHRHGEDGHRVRPRTRRETRGDRIAGDDPSAKEIVFELARDMGFHPVDVGPLKATRELERVVGVMLFVRLGPLRVLSSDRAKS
jgi:hypothetical protein